MPLLNPIDHIPVEAPQASLLTVSRQIPGGIEAWRSGVSWLSNGCNRTFGWSDCDDETRPDEKCDPPTKPIPEFLPWTIYVPDGCSTLPAGRTISYRGRATEVLEAYTPGAVSRELATAEFAPSNPSLESTAALAVNPDPGAQDIVVAIQALVQARITARFYGLHVVHVPFWLIPGMDANGLISDLGRSGMGNVIVSPGPGYPGRNPVVVGAPADPDAGTGWIYISGPVEYGVGPTFSNTDEEGHWRRGNSALVEAERLGIVRFDTCGVFAILAAAGA